MCNDANTWLEIQSRTSAGCYRASDNASVALQIAQKTWRMRVFVMIRVYAHYNIHDRRLSNKNDVVNQGRITHPGLFYC